MKPKEEQKHTDLLPVMSEAQLADFLRDEYKKSANNWALNGGNIMDDMARALLTYVNTRKADCHEEVVALEAALSEVEHAALTFKVRAHDDPNAPDRIAYTKLMNAIKAMRAFLARATNQREG